MSTRFPRAPLSFSILWFTLASACLGDLGRDEPLPDPKAKADESLAGNLEIFVATYEDGREKTFYQLRTESGEQVALQFEKAQTHLQPEEYVEVVGHHSQEKSAMGNQAFMVTDITKHLGVEKAGDGVDRLAGDGRREPFAHKMAVFILGQEGQHRYTRAQIEEQLRTGSGEAADFLAANSGGLETLSGDVFGPYPQVNTATCETSTVAEAVKQIASAQGVQLSEYNKLAFLLPEGSDCEFGGLGQLGRSGSSNQLLTWYNNWFECQVLVHELGHNLGMNHSHGAGCGAVEMSEGSLYKEGREGCHDVEYGHAFDPMGSAGCGGGHFSAPQKEYQGWLGHCEVVTAGETNATYKLTPVGAECGLRSLHIPMQGTGAQYHLEYRQTGAGPFAGARGEDRVILSAFGVGDEGRPAVYQIDATPQGWFRENREGEMVWRQDFKDGWLQVGQVYELPGGVKITVLEQADVATVQVEMAGPEVGSTCRNGELAAKDEAGHVHFQCGQDACPGSDKTAPGFCGCETPDVDEDGDGFFDCPGEDECPGNPARQVEGDCPCDMLELECQGQANGLERRHFSGNWGVLPDFDSLTPTGVVEVVTSLDAADFSGTDNFGLLFSGGIEIETAGEYAFQLGSDDGSRLLIDGRPVVNNDGTHAYAMREGSLELTAGIHTLRVEYFERRGGERLTVKYRKPDGSSFEILPEDVLSHASSACEDDVDEDGTPDCRDACPTNPALQEEGECGCQQSCGGAAGLEEHLDLSDLAGVSGEALRYTVTVTEGGVDFLLKGESPTGDPDLYVREGQEPTEGLFDCRPYHASGKEEACSFKEPGTYHVMVRGFTAFAGWTLTSSPVTTNSGDVRQFPLQEAAVSGASGSVQQWEVSVPEGAHSVKFELVPDADRTSAESGDPDLYVRRGEKPSTKTYDCRPYKVDGVREECQSQDSGTYYIMVRGFHTFEGWTLTGSYGVRSNSRDSGG